MEKTVLQQAIELLQNNNSVWYEDGSACIHIDRAIELLMPLLPIEREQIETAFITGRAMGFKPDSELVQDAQDYFTQTYTMEKIDYKSEVLNMRPDAHGICEVGNPSRYYITSNDEDLCELQKTVKSAWKSAYNNLLAQGKITPKTK